MITLFPLAVNAQEKEVLLSHEIQQIDTAVIRRMIGIGKTLIDISPGKAMNLLEDALILSRWGNHHNLSGNALLQIGNIHRKQRRYHEAITAFQQALQYHFKSIPQNNELAYILYNEIAGGYYYIERYDSAIRYSYEAARILGDYALQKIPFHRNLAVIWLALGENDTALAHLNIALELAEKQQLNNKEKTDTTLELEKVSTYDALCVTYLHKEEYRKAKIFAQKILDNPYKEDLRECLANLFMGKAYLFEKDNDPRKAISYLEKALLCPSGPASTMVVAPNIHLGIAYGMLKDYRQAEHHLIVALRAAETHNLKADRLLSYKHLAQLYENINNTSKAYNYQKAYSGLKDSLVKDDQKTSVLQLEARYQMSKRDKELAENQLLVNNQRAEIRTKNFWIIIISSAVVFLGIIFVISLYNIRRRQKLKNEVLQLKAIMKGEEKERNRLAHELHDGIVAQFSTVKMGLSILPDKYDTLTADDTYQYILSSLDNATRDLRKTAHHLMPDMLLEDGLLEATHYFCRTLMANQNLLIDFQHYGEMPRLDTEFELSVYRIIQELVQNIVKHAQATEAMVQISFFEESLNITIEDNGIGFDTTSIQKGMGLRSITARTKAFNGVYDIKSQPGKGTIVYLEFDIGSIDKG